MSETCVIVGASHAAAQLALSLRQEGWQDSIIVIGDEAHLPYHRPPLSKAFLSGEKDVEGILIRPESIYAKHDIAFKLNTRVTGIDHDNQLLTFDNGEQLTYDRLALCTGSRARRIPLPGSKLPGVCYLRDIRDVEAIKQRVSQGKKAVIVGGGYIGLETASVLKKLGMEVTVLEMMDRVLQRVIAAEVSEFFTRVHTEEGVTIKTGMVVTAIEGKQEVHAVLCQDGTRFAADLVIIGAGSVPNVELAETANLKVDNGILVDEFGTTSDPHIFAAGDCTNHHNPILGRRLRLESVPNATDQAKAVAAAICGKQKAYAAHPWFWSDQYDIKLQIAGLNQGYDQVIIRGDQKSSRSFVAWYLKEGQLLAADCINRPREFIVTKQILANKAPVDPVILADESQDPKSLLAA